jgi:phenylalanyl-tRNA synthetase beta chain
MIISLNYLKSIVPGLPNQEVIAEGLKILGLEVEETVNRNRVKGARIVKVEKIDLVSDKLRIAFVNDGKGNTKKIISNSDKVQVGSVVAVAFPGAIIADATVEERSVRGALSEGVILSAVDFGIDTEILPQSEREGAWILPDDSPINTDPADSMWLNDTILNIKVTPNHPEWLSIKGLLREIAVIMWRDTGKIIEIPNLSCPPINSKDKNNTSIKLQIDNLEDCPWYVGVESRVEVRPSGFETRKRLLAAGLRPINNVVDASNLAMYEDGQPTHAFDADKLTSGVVKVAKTMTPMKFTTLDGTERDIPVGAMMIWDGDKPIAIAGVMGGTDTEVSTSTKRIFLESAFFNPMTVAKTSSKLGLRTEASSRFEKGVSPEQAMETANKVMDLIGTESLLPIEVKAETKRRIVKLRPERITKILGFDIDLKKGLKGLEILGIACTDGNPIKCEISGPRDNDLKAEIDLIEEIIRVIGYDTIPTTFPVIDEKNFMDEPGFAFERRIKRIMAGMGFTECITKVMTNAEQMKSYMLDSQIDKAPKLVNPMTSDCTHMMPSAEIGVIQVASYNLRQRFLNLNLFEVGSQFGPETRSLTIVITGKKPNSWDKKIIKKEPHNKQIESSELDFYDMKGAIESILISLSAGVPQFKESNLPHLHPFRQAHILLDGKQVGYFGQMHPDAAKNIDAPNPVFVANLFIHDLLCFVPEVVKNSKYSKFPAVLRDIAVLCNDTESYNKIHETIRQNGGENLTGIELFDQYIGEFLQHNKKSLALSLSFSDKEGTLVGEDIDKVIAQIEKALESIGASIRKA